MYKNYTFLRGKIRRKKKPMGHSILLASKPTINYPLLPAKKMEKTKTTMVFYKNEL